MQFIPDFTHPDLANLGYLLSFVGLMVKDILVLRFLLLGSHGTLWTVGLLTGNPTVVFWHTIFLLINSWRTILLLWERRQIRFPAEVEALYQEFFNSLSRKEMLILWKNSTEASFVQQTILLQDQAMDRMYFVLEGEAAVYRQGQRLSTLTRGRFLGEMSLITGQGASANVKADQTVRFRTWTYAWLNSVKAQSPQLWMKIQGLLGRDLVSKIYERHLSLSRA